ncbi:transcriptional regulator [Streptomyces abyssalis]|uniref:Transcriptional regulator n=1 Tax=Streptomyces abyssalis TaxID=933944 RepID=A0A1E7JK36_9ACTN|nr:MarR family winged helix-turn-helix transcriptional regulator [Streptomyces abyssalis]OEU88014.1 transcriptional regulator [Streptomyces abyssalis]OEU90876.1 transcriptional regulator [Streptomyces abyssalis]OEV06114.1 transcriptional regulator [Streptomyces nanshensis]
MEFSHPDTELAGQPIGYWSWAAHKAVVGHIREALAAHGVSQPQWWVLAQLAGSEHGRTREQLTAVLSGYLDVGSHLDAEIDAVVARDWARQDDVERLRLTAEGSALHAELATLQQSLRDRIHSDITDEEYVRTLKVLQRMIRNVDGRFWHH